MGRKLIIKIIFLQFLVCSIAKLDCQEISILNFTTDTNGQAQIQVSSNTSHYYVLKVKHTPTSDFNTIASITLGEAGTTILTESLIAYEKEHYQVLEYPIASAFDIDLDGIDDMTEFENLPIRSPINAAEPIDPSDGFLAIDNFNTFKQLSIKKENVPWSEFLNGKGFVKYMITDFNSSRPKIFFIDSNKHNLHADFAAEIGVDYLGDEVKRGQVIYHPTSISNNGTLGAFAFNYSNGHGQDFEVVQKTLELLAANMPFLKNNISYFITELNEDEYERDADLFESSRVPILFEADVYGEIDYWGLNLEEGFGFFRQMGLDEIPGTKDIVLYESLPNALPRVGGVMTTVIQTPLSHVNLRAIQNKIPNAFIRDPLAIDSISNLLNKNIYFRVEQDNYYIREASVEEVNNWYEDIRPKEEQFPPLNLTYTSILPLDEVEFSMYDGFGAKCANVATMRKFGFPAGTIPDGYGVPFYFYQEFMEYNNFFEKIEEIINEEDFILDRDVRNDKLKQFRSDIKKGEMPQWMLDELASMHESFPIGTSVRCRSSTNNEDLPGFNGAGLYDSKTQHPDEGHISKSIKQVFSSLWNLRAFDERDFYRINHFTTSMGVLCHPNYSNELANGVGVSIDPLYNTENTFYLNTQVGEELITNPGNTSIPEEVLLDRVSASENDFIVIQRSNLSLDGELILDEKHLDEMREYLSVIHDEFEILYEATGQKNFAMDVEFKITIDDQLIFKQARPWVSYILDEEEPILGGADLDFNIFPNPTTDYLNVQRTNENLQKIIISNINGMQILEAEIGDEVMEINVRSLAAGVYVISGFSNEDSILKTMKFIKK